VVPITVAVTAVNEGAPSFSGPFTGSINENDPVGELHCGAWNLPSTNHSWGGG